VTIEKCVNTWAFVAGLNPSSVWQLNFYLLEDECLERSFECMHRLPTSFRTMNCEEGIWDSQSTTEWNAQLPSSQANRLDPERLPENFGKVVVTRIWMVLLMSDSMLHQPEHKDLASNEIGEVTSWIAYMTLTWMWTGYLDPCPLRGMLLG